LDEVNFGSWTENLWIFFRCLNYKPYLIPVPTTRSRTVTLLRLRSSYRPTDATLLSTNHNGIVVFSHLRQAYFQTVTGGLYRTPAPVHRSLADLRLLAIPTSRVSNCRKRFVLRKHLFLDC